MTLKVLMDDDGGVMLTFGKFKGQTVAQVFHQAPWYLAWAGRNRILPPTNLFVYAAMKQHEQDKDEDEDRMQQYLFGHDDWGNRE